MPIINLTQDDINRQKQPDAGWHLAVLFGVVEAASKDKGSINWKFDFEICQGASEGRHATDNVNSKAVGMRLIPIASALLNIPIDAVEAGKIDTDKLVGKKCYIEVQDSIYEGRIVKKIMNFSPEGNPPF